MRLLSEAEVSRSNVFSFVDPLQYAAHIRAADIEVFPTTKGEFRTQLTQVTFDQQWMQRTEENLPRIHRGAIRLDRKVFTFLTEDQPEVYNRGKLLSVGELCANDNDMQHVVTTGHYRFGGISLKLEDFAAKCESMLGVELRAEQCNGVLRPPPELMKRFLELHALVAALAKTTPELLTIPELVRSVEHKLTHAFLACVVGCNPSKVMEATLRNRVVMDRFEAFIEAHPNTPLYLDQVCVAIGVAERTLRAICEDHLGMGPVRYLTLRRMHLARRALTRALPGSATVTQIATTHGFWELGRFSVAYRETFGESPLATLRRPPHDVTTKADRPQRLHRLPDKNEAGFELIEFGAGATPAMGSQAPITPKAGDFRFDLVSRRACCQICLDRHSSRDIAGCVRFFTLTQCFCRPPR
ncbi:helix-turn-helix domain-containing protein [Bradyrhizobium sp. F1.13.3]|uniref:helix-turn-helix domain-containing protein n=1 Tax=Bradyrhizobium sp. F1.13.3 TaxID=3156351 RepID=UPI0033944B11